MSLVTVVFAQSHTSGRFNGTVKDQSGAVIAGAEVTVKSLATGEERKATTDPHGNYDVSLLLPGTYRVSVTASGFRKADVEPVRVSITETSELDVKLEVGAISEEAVVRAAGPLIQTGGPQQGRVVNSRAVAELPLATRNFTQILALSPGTFPSLIG